MSHILASHHRRVASIGTVVVAVAAIGLLGSGTANAALPASGQTVMTSVTPASSSTEGGAPSSDSAVSADGRYVTFTSFATDIVATPSHATSQVYKRDIATGVTTLVSVGIAATGSGDKQSLEPSISSDGRFVAFLSAATNLTLPADTANTSKQIYVRDTVAGTTRKVSLTPALVAGGDEDSSSPSISADGSLVAFQSGADDLVAGITPTDIEVYVAKNAVDPAIRLVNARKGTVGDLSDSDGFQPSISGDGSTVVFVSAATDLVTAKSGGVAQVYARDIVNNTTELLSFDATNTGVAGNAPSESPVASFDGSKVAYESIAKNLVSANINLRRQVFRYDRASAQNTLVSFSVANVSGTTGQVGAPSISGDGSKIAFASTPGSLTSTSDNGFEQVYVRDMAGSSTTMISVQAAAPSSGGTEDSLAPSLSMSGDLIGFTSFSPGLSATSATFGRSQTYLRAIGASVITPTPTATDTGGTGLPMPSPTVGSGTGATSGGLGGSSGSGSHLASTGLNQAPLLIGAIAAAMLSLVGGSIAWGARTARQRRATAADPLNRRLE